MRSTGFGRHSLYLQETEFLRAGIFCRKAGPNNLENAKLRLLRSTTLVHTAGDVYVDLLLSLCHLSAIGNASLMRRLWPTGHRHVVGVT